MIYLYSFLIAGFICLIGQLIFEFTNFTPGHITSLFVVIGAGLDTFSLYDKLVLATGGGALVPITSFGHLLTHGALKGADQFGFTGLLIGLFSFTAAGISSTIIIAFIVSLIFKPKN